jgi:hypothetical protein
LIWKNEYKACFERETSVQELVGTPANAATQRKNHFYSNEYADNGEIINNLSTCFGSLIGKLFK